MPAAFSIASFAVDGVSLVSTGKSVRDHAISVIADEDCALWRVVAGRPVCQEATGPIVAFLPIAPIQEPARDRDELPQSDVLREETAASSVSEAAEGEQPVDTAADEGDASTAEESLAQADMDIEETGEAGPVAIDTLAIEEAAPGGAVAEGGPTRQFVVLVDEPAQGPAEAKLRRAPAGSPSSRLAVPASDRGDRAAEAKHILAAKAAGIAPHALTDGGEWRPIDSGQGAGQGAGLGAGLARVFDSVLASLKGLPKPAEALAAGGPSVYLVFGTFTESSKAEAASRHFAAFTTRVLGDSRGSRKLYRVVAGPYGPGAAHSAREMIAQNGAPHVWLLRL